MRRCCRPRRAAARRGRQLPAGKVQADWPRVDVVPDVDALLAPRRHRPDRGRRAQCPAPSAGQGGARGRQACGGRQALHARRRPGARTGGTRAARARAVGLPEPPLRRGFPDAAALLAERGARPPGVPGVAFRPLPARGARALARAAGAGRRPLGRPGLAPDGPGRSSCSAGPTHCNWTPRGCATARWSRTTSTPCCATRAARMRPCAWCCTPPRWRPIRAALHPARHAGQLCQAGRGSAGRCAARRRSPGRRRLGADADDGVLTADRDAGRSQIQQRADAAGQLRRLLRGRARRDLGRRVRTRCRPNRRSSSWRCWTWAARARPRGGRWSLTKMPAKAAGIFRKARWPRLSRRDASCRRTRHWSSSPSCS